MSSVVGLIGCISSGKNSCANHLVEEYGYIPLSFANALKGAVSSMYGWDRALLEGDTEESREWREIPCPYWSHYLDADSATPRIVLQRFGTEYVRNQILRDFWGKRLAKEIDLANPNTNYVITDARFSNECDLITAVGGTTIRVERPDTDPHIVKQLLARVRSGQYVSLDELEIISKSEGIHMSELEHVLVKEDISIINDAELQDMFVALEEALS